jgi:NAD(P)-dependent dehydrogenase (short-subunit alcohol dehydrogenase family)
MVERFGGMPTIEQMASEKREFAGKRALVTGGSRGIGAEVVRRLLDAGAQVITSGRSVRSTTPQGAVFVEADVTTPAGVEALAARTQEVFGAVDLVVHSAGGARPQKDGVTIPDAEWRDALDLNLLSAVRLNSLLVPGMQERRSGAIVHISTAATTPPAPVFLHYQAAKAALDNYSAGLAATLAPFGIRVNTVSPGRTVTPGGQETREYWEALNGEPAATDTPPLGRDGEPGDIADAVLFLLSGQASWLTGTNVAVDGGEYPRG